MTLGGWVVLGCLAGAAAQAADTKPGHAGGTAVKPVVCRAVPDARGKTGQELAQALERDAIELAATGYVMAGIVPGDPPVVCYRHQGPPPKPGAR